MSNFIKFLKSKIFRKGLQGNMDLILKGLDQLVNEKLNKVKASFNELNTAYAVFVQIDILL